MATEGSIKSGFCNVCARTVYFGPGERDKCPVCSAPLLRVDDRDVGGSDADLGSSIQGKEAHGNR